MVDYLEILRLSSDLKNSQRCIASIVHCSRHTIRAVLEAAKKAGLSWPLDDTVTNETLKRVLFPERATAETLHTPPDYPYIHRELARPGVNLTLCGRNIAGAAKTTAPRRTCTRNSAKSTGSGRSISVRADSG